VVFESIAPGDLTYSNLLLPPFFERAKS
jgi:hypothetical protein